MPAVRSSARLAARLAAKEEAIPYTPPASRRRNAKASNATSNATKDVDNSAASSRAATTRKKRTIEKCTEQQTAELERLYKLADGYPTTNQKKQTAQDIGKTYRSVQTWMQNRLEKARKSTAKPTVGESESQDTIMIDVAASGRLKEPVAALDSPLPRTTNAKKPKGRAAKAPMNTARPTRVKRQPATKPRSMPIRCSPGIDISTNDATTMDLDHPSGDSNASTSPSARIATPAIIQSIVRQPWVATRPERQFNEYTLDEVYAAAVIALLQPRAENPAYNPRVLIYDP